MYCIDIFFLQIAVVVFENINLSTIISTDFAFLLEINKLLSPENKTTISP
jgi:hypothetical protein